MNIYHKCKPRTEGLRLRVSVSGMRDSLYEGCLNRDQSFRVLVRKRIGLD